MGSPALTFPSRLTSTTIHLPSSQTPQMKQNTGFRRSSPHFPLPAQELGLTSAKKLLKPFPLLFTRALPCNPSASPVRHTHPFSSLPQLPPQVSLLSSLTPAQPPSGPAPCSPLPFRAAGDNLGMLITWGHSSLPNDPQTHL